MTARVLIIIVRLLFLLELLIGVSYWAGQTFVPSLLHMFLGLGFIVAVWALGLMQGMVRGGTIGLMMGTFVAGLALAGVGIAQGLAKNGFPWWLGAIHFVLALATIGTAEASYARHKRAMAATAS